MIKRRIIYNPLLLLKWCSILLILFLNVSELTCQPIVFTQLTKNYTNAIFPDHNGLIWISTQDGLLRYDSYDYKTLRYIRENPKSLPNNFVWDIVEDFEGKLWVGTFGGGFAKYDKQKETFTSFFCEPNDISNQKSNSVRNLTISKDSILWLGTESGVYGFDLQKEEFLNNQFWQELNNIDWFVYDILLGPKYNFIATENGLYRVENKNNVPVIEKISLSENENLTVTDLELHNDQLFIATEEGLLVSDYDLIEKVDNHFLQHNQLSVRVHHIFFDSNQELWLGTENGLAHFNNDIGYTWHRHDPTNLASLKSNIIHFISEIEQGIMMVATRQGVHQFSNTPSKFKNLNPQYDQTSCSKTTLGMLEDHEKNIWICSRSGLTKIDYQPNIRDWSATCYTPEREPGMVDPYTINISQDDQHDYWVTYRYNGFSKFQKKGDHLIWTDYPKTNALFNGEGVNQIFQDSQQKYWIATRGFGLMAFFPEKDSVVTYNESANLSHPYIFRIFEDSQQQLWVATANGGLCSFDRNTKKFECSIHNSGDSESLSSNMALAISEDRHKRLWIPTVNGLNIKQDTTNTFKTLTMLDGLPNNVIYAAIEDSNGFIWLSTNEGIVKLNPDLENIELEVFGFGDGIVDSEFNQHSFLKHSSGLFLFGSINGVVVFDPLDMSRKDIDPGIIFTDFSLFNVPVPVLTNEKKNNSNEFSLEKSINHLDQITLKYNQNTLSFQFAALNFDPSVNVHYAYKMEGLEKEWVFSGTRRFASYPKMPPDQYTFMVKTMNSDNQLNGQLKSIIITILPPPWKTWWAYLLYGLLIVSVIYLLLWAQTQRRKAIEKAKEAVRDRFRKKMSQDFHDEAGNKITLMTLIADRVERKTESTEIKSLVTDLQNQIQALRLGMRDFIWVMDPSRDSLFDTVIRIRDFGIHMCEQAEINFKDSGRNQSLRQLEMNGNDRRHFLLIFKEAINNAIKYSQAPNISFNIISNVQDQLTFELVDDGIGFDHSNESMGNGLSNMQHRAKMINSIFNIKSKKGHGTRISILWKYKERQKLVQKEVKNESKITH